MIAIAGHMIAEQSEAIASLRQSRQQLGEVDPGSSRRNDAERATTFGRCIRLGIARIEVTRGAPEEHEDDRFCSSLRSFCRESFRAAQSQRERRRGREAKKTAPAYSGTGSGWVAANVEHRLNPQELDRTGHDTAMDEFVQGTGQVASDWRMRSSTTSNSNG